MLYVIISRLEAARAKLPPAARALRDAAPLARHGDFALETIYPGQPGF